MIKFIKYGSPALLIAVGLYYWKHSPAPAVNVAIPAAQSTSTVAEPSVASPSKIETQISPPVLEKSKVPVVTGLSPEDLAQFKPQMADFALLKKRVLKSDDDKNKWNAILRNPHAVYRARKLLLAPTLENKDLQDQAIDFLVNAAKNGDPNAQNALESVIADSLIESTNADRSTQQFKAELKAVAMYEWSSAHPEKDSHISGLLPGPVSKKIWSNVLAQQANNEAESALD